MLGQNEQLQEYQDRFRVLYGIIFVIMLILLLRVWYLQILQGEKFRRYSEENRLKKSVVMAPRGMIFDRNRQMLVDNQPTFSLTITPQYFRAASKKERVAIIKKLSKIVKVSEKQIVHTLRKARRQPSFQSVTIKKNLSQYEVALIEMEKLDLSGVDVAVGIRRTNVNKLIGSQTLGYISKINKREIPRLNKKGRRYSQHDSIGKSGLEQEWESLLKGNDGVTYLEVDAFGRKKTTLGKSAVNSVFNDLAAKKARPGNNLVLTIDQDLQEAAARAFGDEKTGAIVALNPNNGEILSMLSWPSFDSTVFSTGIKPDYWKFLLNNEDKPLLNKAIQEHYGPASTFKVVAAIAALEEGMLKTSTVVSTPSSFRYGGRTYHDWKKSGFGSANIVKALTQSVDVYFWKLATRMDIDTLAKYGKMLGLGSKTGVQLPGEQSGILPTRAWKKKEQGKEWYPGETLSVIIGQGYLTATPIQLANMMAAIANGGTIYRPRLIKYVESSDGEIIRTTRPDIIRKNQFKETTMRAVKKGLEGVMSHKRGTARWYAIPGIPMAGKTGTSQVIRFSADKIYGDCTKLERKFRHHGLFIGYAPIENPQIAVAVVAEHACAGSSGATPIAMEVIKTYLAKINPDKYGEKQLKAARIKYWKKIQKERQAAEALKASEES